MAFLYQLLAPNQTFPSQRTSRIPRKLFAIGISMQNESQLYREMVHNGKKGRLTFDLYSSPSANPLGKLLLRQLVNPFCVLSAELLMFEIVQNFARLIREWRPFRISHTRRKWGEPTRSAGRALKWADVCGIAVALHRMPTKILGYNRSIGYKYHRVIIGQITSKSRICVDCKSKYNLRTVFGAQNHRIKKFK